MSTQFKVGDYVWAKRRRFCPLPAKIINTDEALQKTENPDSYYVYFYGINKYDWIKKEKVRDYTEYKQKLNLQSAIFSKAVQEVELDIQNPENKKRTLEEETEEEQSKKLRLGDTNTIDNNNKIPKEYLIDFNNSAHKSVQSTESQLSFGFLGLGALGLTVVKHLIKSGCKLNLWNRNQQKAEYIRIQAENVHPGQVNTCQTPSEIMDKSDVIFVCLDSQKSVAEIVYGKDGILDGRKSLANKGYVEMTNVDVEFSKEMFDKISSLSGQYIEAQFQYNREKIENEPFIILIAGDRNLYDICQDTLETFSRTLYMTNEVGVANKLNKILQMMKGIIVCGVAEAFALADRAGIEANSLRKCLLETNICNEYMLSKVDMMETMEFTNVEQSLQSMQNDMRMALQLTERTQQNMALLSAANEIYKHARKLKLDNSDCSSIYLRCFNLKK